MKQSDSQMKVTHVITGLENGGAESILFQLCVGDRLNSHQVVSLSGPGKYGPMLEGAGVPVHYFYFKPGLLSIFRFFSLVRFLKKLQPPLVHTWLAHANLFGSLASLLAGNKNIYWAVHNGTLGSGLSRPSFRIISALLVPLSRKVPTKIVACADSAAFEHIKAGYPSEKFEVIFNGYDVMRFIPGKTIGLPSLDGREPERRIGMIARFSPLKDHRTFLSAIGILKKRGHALQILMAGIGMEQSNAKLVKMIASQDLENEIKLRGQVENIEDLYQEFELLVLSSLSEAFPNVVAEAMASGLACVATDVGDVRQIIGDTGWVVPAGDANSLAEAVNQALSLTKPALIERGMAARERIIQEFSLERMLGRYHTLYRSSVNH